MAGAREHGLEEDRRRAGAQRRAPASWSSKGSGRARARRNGSEGLYAKAGKRRSRLEDASARETLMALRIAGACGYLPAAEAAVVMREVDGVIAVLWVLAYRR